MDSLLNNLASLVAALRRYVATIPPAQIQPPTPSTMPVEPPKPVPAPPVPITPESMQQMVIRVCKEKSLGIKMTSDLYKTIHCESDFNPKCVHPNIVNGHVSSTDYGICQINDYWHIGAGKDFPSVDYVLNHPEACVRFMCDMFLAGKARLWVCYLRGMYLNY